jgi:YHS domain-containing protein
MKMHQDNPNIQGISIVNGEIKVIEKKLNAGVLNEAPAKELVKDIICDKELEKKDAYRVFKDGKEYYFCSWECREKFLKQYAEEEGSI